MTNRLEYMFAHPKEEQQMIVAAGIFAEKYDFSAVTKELENFYFPGTGKTAMSMRKLQLDCRRY